MIILRNNDLFEKEYSIIFSRINRKMKVLSKIPQKNPKIFRFFSLLRKRSPTAHTICREIKLRDKKISKKNYANVCIVLNHVIYYFQNHKDKG